MNNDKKSTLIILTCIAQHERPAKNFHYLLCTPTCCPLSVPLSDTEQVPCYDKVVPHLDNRHVAPLVVQYRHRRIPRVCRGFVRSLCLCAQQDNRLCWNKQNCHLCIHVARNDLRKIGHPLSVFRDIRNFYLY